MNFSVVLKDVEFKEVVTNCDKAKLGGVDVVSEGGSVIAPPNSTQELDPMPGVIVTSRIEGAIASSNFPQA